MELNDPGLFRQQGYIGGAVADPAGRSRPINTRGGHDYTPHFPNEPVIWRHGSVILV